MFGVDVVVEKGTGHHVVVDINYFPGKFGSSLQIFANVFSRVQINFCHPGLSQMFFLNFFTIPA